MTDTPPPGARAAPSTARNREPILAVLAPRLGIGAKVLEIASGAGEHAVFVGEALPGVQWVPSDPDPEARASIAAWVEQVRAGQCHPAARRGRWEAGALARRSVQRRRLHQHDPHQPLERH